MGFTLPEVLLSLAILAVAAVAAGQAVRASLGLLERARNVEQPPLGWTIGREALLRAGSIDEAEEGGRIDLPDAGNVDWEADVEETELPDLFEVVLRVEAEDREKTETLFLFRPAWSSPIDRGPLQEEARRQIEDRLREVNR